MRRDRVVAFALTAIVAPCLFGLGSAPAGAQATGAPCAQAPLPPRGLSANVEQAVQGRTAAEPPTPALVTLRWREPEGSDATRVPATYAVEVGSTPGASNVATIDTDGLVLSYVSPAPNGTFYLRVRASNACGRSEPSSERMVRIRGSAEPGAINPAAIVDAAQGLRERLAGSEFVQITGQVRNGWGAARASFVEVRGIFEGPRGDLRESAVSFVNGASWRLMRSGLVTDTVLDPNASGCFVLFAQLPQGQNVTGLRLSVRAREAPGAQIAGQVVALADMPRVDAFGDLIVRAQVINRGSVPTVMNQLWTELLDANGRVVGCRGALVSGADRTTAGRLRAGESAAVDTMTEVEAAKARRLVQWTTWEDEAPVGAATDEYRRLRQRLAELLRDENASLRDITIARDALRRTVQAIEDAAR